VLEQTPRLPRALTPDVASAAPIGAHFVSLLSRDERSRCIERGLAGLYRWYVARSQAVRRWNPDSDFGWARLRRDHADGVHIVVEGFYGVEQYAPDYVRTLLRVIRESYGRSHFHLQWGAEEEKHSELWRNCVLSLGRRSVAWVEAHTDTLRAHKYEMPWDDALHMLFYTVLQERATYVVYRAFERAARGVSHNQTLGRATDPVLASACATIALDEAAHYHFFLEASRLFIYYFPDESLSALVDVLRHFAMPAGDLIPDYSTFGQVLQQAELFGRRRHYEDVVTMCLRHLSVPALRALEAGIRDSRRLPPGERESDVLKWVDAEQHERAAENVFRRVKRYAADAGIAHTMATEFLRARAGVREEVV
jgi:acyl-[acyl-carrier-protein] desaturase